MYIKAEVIYYDPIQNWKKEVLKVGVLAKGDEDFISDICNHLRVKREDITILNRYSSESFHTMPRLGLSALEYVKILS